MKGGGRRGRERKEEKRERGEGEYDVIEEVGGCEERYGVSERRSEEMKKLRDEGGERRN